MKFITEEDLRDLYKNSPYGLRSEGGGTADAGGQTVSARPGHRYV